MRPTNIAIAIYLFACSHAFAAEAIQVEPQAVGTEQQESSEQYHFEWQQRLLAVQHTFTASLPRIDKTVTGSITPQDQ